MKWLLIVLLVSGCAGPMPSSHLLDIDRCDDGDIHCVMEEVDKIPESAVPMIKRYLYLEGYKLTNVTELYAFGRLSIREISPWLSATALLGIGPLARSRVFQSKFGDIHHAEIEYATWMPGANRMLAHELQHVKGISGWMRIGYGSKQIVIMEAEGVGHWYDTSVYKAEDDAYHFIMGEN